MSEWRPIETAPKDGTYILIWHLGIGSAVVGSWRKSNRNMTDSREKWRPYCSGYDDQELLAALHWMPLPEPPK